MLPLDTSVEAQYADGFILSETEHNDQSPFNPTHNILGAILNKDAEVEHGPMVKFSVFYKDQRYDIDWRDLPADARPIRFRHGYSTMDGSGNIESGWSGVDFGYQYTDAETGKNIKEVQEIR